MSTLGRCIVVEGLEGAGKSTAMTTISQLLQQHVDAFITTREPGGTLIGEALRHLIKQLPNKEVLDPRAELLLLYASRVQLLEQVIKPALLQGKWVLADRFELSTYAYQGGGRGLDGAMIDQLSSFCLSGFTPDLVLFLEVTPEMGLQRASSRGQVDRIEQESLDFFRAVDDAYHAKIKTMPQVVIIDASQPEAEVQSAITRSVTDFLRQHHHLKVLP